jgi:hypothetical protein
MGVQMALGGIPAPELTEIAGRPDFAQLLSPAQPEYGWDDAGNLVLRMMPC